jgi:sugar/nucleoside kinase (ribokinase family)
MKQPSVLVLGNTTVDHVLSMPEPIQSDAKLNAKTYEVYAGGQASNVAAGLALLGHDVGFIGRFGDDSGAAISKRSFQEIGIDLSLSSTVSGCRHHFACILVNGSDRMIAMYRDPRLSLDDTEVPLDTVARCAAVYTDGHEGAASLRLAEKAARSGTPLIIDIEVVTPDTEALARLADHVVAPAEIVLRLGRESDLRNAMRSILAAGPTCVVATMGHRGSAGLETGSAELELVPAAHIVPEGRTFRDARRPESMVQHSPQPAGHTRARSRAPHSSPRMNCSSDRWSAPSPVTALIAAQPTHSMQDSSTGLASRACCAIASSVGMPVPSKTMASSGLPSNSRNPACAPAAEIE